MSAAVAALQQENVAPATEVQAEEMECGPMPIEKLQVRRLGVAGRAAVGSEAERRTSGGAAAVEEEA